MKRHFLTLLLLIAFASSLKAQTEKGTFLLGGSDMLDLANLTNLMEYTNSSNNETKRFELSISPIVGYFIIDNLSVGVIPRYRYKKDKDTSSEISARDISLSAYSRYYLGKKKLKPFLHLGIGYINRYAQNEYDFENGSFSWKGNTPMYEAGLGLGYFITGNLSLDLFALYTYSKTNMNWKGDSMFDQNFDNVLKTKDLDINVSLIFYFSRSTKSETD